MALNRWWLEKTGVSEDLLLRKSDFAKTKKEVRDIPRGHPQKTAGPCLASLGSVKLTVGTLSRIRLSRQNRSAKIKRFANFACATECF